MTCAFEWGEGKTFRIRQTIRKAGGTVAAEIDAVGGLLDLEARKPVPAPHDRFKRLATDPGLFGL